MNFSRILIAGLVGVTVMVAVKKLINRNQQVFEDISFDSEFIPTYKNSQVFEDVSNRPKEFKHPKLHAEDADNPLFI